MIRLAPKLLLYKIMLSLNSQISGNFDEGRNQSLDDILCFTATNKSAIHSHRTQISARSSVG